MKINKTELFNTILDTIINKPFELLSECSDDRTKMKIILDIIQNFKDSYTLEMCASYDSCDRNYNEEIVDRLNDVEMLFNNKLNK